MLVHTKKMVMLMDVDVDFQQKQDCLEVGVLMVNGKNMITTIDGMDMGLENTDSGKIANNVLGLETGGKNFAVDKQNLDELAKAEAINKFNEQVDEYTERFDKYNKVIEEESIRLTDEFSKLEIKPFGQYVLIKPFSQNPFQRIKKEGNIITDLGGLAPIIKSNETGEFEEEESYIRVGTVVEVGPDVRYLEIGDTVMWTVPTELPIPFYKQGLVSVFEQNIKCIINVGLEDRFNRIKKERNNGR